MAFIRAAIGAVVLVVVFLAGLWIGVGAGGKTVVGGPQPSSPAPAASPTLRPSELPGPDEAVTTGQITFQVLGWRCGLLAVQGDHADWLADGQYCRVRLRMSSADRHVHVFTAAPQTLITADGARHRVNLNAMSIQDQPAKAEARPFAVLEFDLWFDIPPEAEAVAVHLYGEDDTRGARVDLALP